MVSSLIFMSPSVDDGFLMATGLVLVDIQTW